jgi:AcrR family transcriptional regulator
MNPLAEETRQRLLDAAGETFAEKGFTGATVRGICRRIDANIASVNYHFGDKEQLYVEAVKAAHCGRVLSPPDWPPGTLPADKLRHFIRTMLENILDPGRPAWHARLMMREMAEPTAACAAVVDAFIRPMAVHLMEMVGEILPPGTNPVDLHLACFSIVGQCLFYKVHKPIIVHLVGAAEYAGYDVDRLAEHISRFSLAALGVNATASGGCEPPDS